MDELQFIFDNDYSRIIYLGFWGMCRHLQSLPETTRQNHNKRDAAEHWLEGTKNNQNGQIGYWFVDYAVRTWILRIQSSKGKILLLGKNSEVKPNSTCCDKAGCHGAAHRLHDHSYCSPISRELLRLIVSEGLVNVPSRAHIQTKLSWSGKMS